MRVLVDCDGVLSDFIGAICGLLNRTPEDFKTWNIHEELTPVEYDMFLHYASQPGFCHALPWYKGARIFADVIKELATEALVVTAPFRHSHTWTHERTEWLSPVFPSNQILYCPTEWKHVIEGDVLIEDNLETLTRWVDQKSHRKGILLDRPWNRSPLRHERIGLAENYSEAIELLRGQQYDRATGKFSIPEAIPTKPFV